VRDGVEAVEGIPVQWVAADVPQGVALWLTHLGGSAEQTAPMLVRLAERGLLAISFDPPGHGRRAAGGEPCELAGEVLAAFRRRRWPLAGRTALEPLRVLDWVDKHFAVSGRRVAGGVSMGGDVAVADTSSLDLGLTDVPVQRRRAGAAAGRPRPFAAGR
jgi:uncharacterized protein